MFSRRTILAIAVLACLAGVILANEVEKKEVQPDGRLCQFLCDACKNVAMQMKQGLPMAKEQIKAMCKSCGAPENVDKCKKKIDEIADKVEKETPEQICQMVGLCKQSHFLNMLGL